MSEVRGNETDDETLMVSESEFVNTTFKVHIWGRIQSILLPDIHEECTNEILKQAFQTFSSYIKLSLSSASACRFDI